MKLRFQITKEKEIRFISHLEYVRTIGRAIRRAKLPAAYSQGFDLSFTDDASVARRYGIPLSYIAGERNNIKLTTPEDLSLAEAILQLSC